MKEAINKESLPHEFATIGKSNFRVLKYGTLTGAHQMEPPSPIQALRVVIYVIISSIL